MVSTLLENLARLVVSMPTNMIILFVILAILHFLCNVKIKDCLKIAVGYILIVFLCGLFGFSLPGLLDIGKWIVATVQSIWSNLWQYSHP